MKKYSNGLNINDENIITAVGAGGKTSTIRHLAREMDKRVMITTTTHFLSFVSLDTVEVMSQNLEEMIDQIRTIWKNNPDQKIILGRSIQSPPFDVEGNKIKGIPPEWVDKLAEHFPWDTILVEGDGSAMRPIKAPADYEPVVPTSTDLLLPILGMKVMGSEINNNNCHRLEQIRRLSSGDDGQRIDRELIVNILTDIRSYGHYIDKVQRYIPVLNQVDEDSLKQVREIAVHLVQKKGINRVLLADTSLSKPVREVITS